MITVEELENEFKIKQNEANVCAVRMSIARQGINVEAISRQDFDRIMRCNMAILDIREKANMQIDQINQAAAEEHNKLVAKMQDALARYQPALTHPTEEGMMRINEAGAKITPEPVVEAEPVTQFTAEKEKETITTEDVRKAEEVLVP